MSEHLPTIGLAEIADIVSKRTDGQLPLIVGGQAVNIWAIVYAFRAGPILKAYEPFISKDLDLYGSRKILDDISERYRVPIKLSPPRFPGIGQVVIPKGEAALKVELLSGVRGIRCIGDENAVEMNVQGVNLRVLDPISCLKAKISNAAVLDQTDRQDVKHINIMKICAAEYAKDILAGGPELFSERVVVNLLERLRETITSPEARQVTQKWNVPFDDVLPLDAIQKSKMSKIQSFLQHRLPQETRPRIPPLKQRQGGHGLGM